ncbi:hypothetical protein R50073_06990 [Maricurvus nonylphenolicus]|uniref:TetR/AcrR family transcriptional regulator n=1 Tax=Maricurvus nonylphenolicus TaxID=1008307 RepID=UPI0036F23566
MAGNKKDSGSTKESILRIACEKYLESGDKGLSMRSIAKEVGITPMAIYRHFENKEALQQELLMEAFRTFSRYLYAGLKGADAKERFFLTVDAYLDFAAEQSAYFELIFLTVNPMNNLKMQEVIKEESLPSFRFLMDRVQDCISEGYFKDGNVYEISVAMLAQSTGLAALHLSHNFDWSTGDAKVMQRKVFDQILSGFLA